MKTKIKAEQIECKEALAPLLQDWAATLDPKLSDRAVARLLGVSSGPLWLQYRDGDSLPSVATLKVICKVTGIDPRAVMGLSAPKEGMAITALQARAEELLEQATTQETAEQLAMIAQAFKAISCAVQVSLDPNKWSDAGLHFEELAERIMRPVVAWQGGQ